MWESAFFKHILDLAFVLYSAKRFEVLTAANIKTWNVTPCGLVYGYSITPHF